jgi:non-specific serine/threonine protein kinase
MKANENLLYYIKAHSKVEIKKGFSVFANSMYEIMVVGKVRKRFTIEVPSQSNSGSYMVTLNVLAGNVEDDCECKAYESNGHCKHAIAAAFALLTENFDYDPETIEDLFETDGLDEDVRLMKNLHIEKTNTGKKKGDNIVPLSSATEQPWKQFTEQGILSPEDLNTYSGYLWPTYAQINKISQTGFNEEARHWTLAYKDKKLVFIPEIRYDGKETYYYRCNCNSTARKHMCMHVRFAFQYLLQYKGADLFFKYRDWTEEKNKALQPYGLTVADEEFKLFQFYVTHYGQLQMQAPSAYIRQGDKEQLKKLSRLFKSKENKGFAEVVRPKPLPDTVIDFETAFVFNGNSQRLKLGFELEVAKLYQRQQKIDLKKLSLNQPANLALLKEFSDETYSLLVQLTDNELLDYLQMQGYGSLKNYANPWPQLSAAMLAALKMHYIQTMQKLWPTLAQHPQVFLLEEGKFSSSNCKPVTLSTDEVELSFRVTADDRFITVWQILRINAEPVTNTEILMYHGFIFSVKNVLHILKNIDDLPVVEQFANGFIKVAASSKLDVIQDLIAPLQERFAVQLPEDFEIKTVHAKPQPQVMLKEFNNQYLMLQPMFLYEETEVDYSNNPEDILISLPDGAMQLIKRDEVLEKQFFETLRPLHETFSRQRQNEFFYVHFNEVMKGNWFLNTVRYLQENGITVKGMQELKKFRYNTHTPKWEMKAGSGMDWFDLQVSIIFGDQHVLLKDVRKALLSKQNIVVLGDGTFGVLPEEWLEQYGMLLKMGDEQKDGSLRLSKLHFTIIDELHNQINDEAILQEIESKKQKLQNIEHVQTAGVSKNIKAKLRPYQLSGFQWMQTLDEMGWGGCLADDMGLGKTLQAISFLQYMKEKHKSSTHLVVCPTSLIYNWETELKKFAPKLHYHIYYGAGREFTDEHFENYDIIITSYGLVRIDMEQLLRFQWHYVLLDESQAIKNPDAQTTKAVQLLKCKNKFILSGTPVQNNTFDLFAQFNFLNPGLLGNKEFYKTEFANPIDKYNDTDKSKQLRRLVYPFLLRRTKEEVAKDLPNKTETILWCQLPKEQRGVYEDYKNYYRNMLMKKIEEEGMSKAGIYVLEGLLRLRQICDSPQLLKDAEVTTTESIKITELLREMEENTGTHKMLVFSQFTEMLHLIKDGLEQKNISYCYLDGSVPAAKRAQQVQEFQTNASVKVFLISLKAGGVGLNLTAADYVYIVDPWWNPAAEQQAIDRTHRIGQTQKIFAYKMICKDTVEEKIVQLQQRKKQIANELVTEDTGFIKKLSREDVAFLFS